MKTKKESKFNAAKKYVFRILKSKLKSNLYYHNLIHTKNALADAEKLAKKERIKEESLLLLKTAVLYHDIGFIEKYEKNEPIGAKIAAKTLPKFGYSKNQIKRIKKIIMATQLKKVNGKMKQVPDRKDKLQKLICDADLLYLGTIDFFRIGENYRKELWQYGTKINSKDWNKVQIDFLKNHTYFTKTAKKLRDKGKQMNLKKLIK